MSKMTFKFSAIVLLVGLAAVKTSAAYTNNNPPSSAPGDGLDNGGGGWSHKERHHGRRHGMFDMPLNMCGIDCSSQSTEVAPTSTSDSNNNNNNDNGQQQCWTCIRDCKHNSVDIGSGQETRRNQTRACMDNAIASIIPAGSCSDAFNCTSECLKSAKHHHGHHSAGGQRHGEGKKGGIQECLTRICPNFCSSVHGCVDRQNNNNQICSLQQELRRAGRQCDLCHAQCVGEGSCIAQYI